MAPPVSPVHPMHLTVDPYGGQVELVRFGAVLDALPDARWRPLTGEPRIAFALEADETTIRGLCARSWAELDVAEIEADVLWDGPRFHVPVLGLEGAPAGEVLLAVRGRFAEDEPTADALFLRRGRDCEELGQAVGHFQLALEAGEMRAHLWLGHTLCALGRHAHAYDHLRRFTELAPGAAWAWCRLGETCAALGRLTEARGAFTEALRHGEDTRAAELLAALEEPA